MGIPLRVIENWSIHCVNDTVMFIKYNLCLQGKIYSQHKQKNEKH